jgi:hypothetical protein
MTSVLLALGLLLASQNPGSTTVLLSGRVLDGDARTPIVGARVTLDGQNVRQEVTTDREGGFHFEGLAAGRYRVTAGHAGFIASPMAAAGPATAAGMVTLSGPSGGVELLLYRGGVIAGQVFDDMGAPLARVRVQALRRAAAMGAAGLQGPPVVTNDLGEFRLAPLMAGEYVVLATPPGGPPRGDRTLAPTYYPSTTDPQAATSVTLRPGETPFAAVTMLAVPAYEIAGVVTDEQGRPRAGALVSLILQQTRGQMAMQVSMRAVPSGPDGTFRIRGLVAGQYRLAVTEASPGPSPPASPADVLPGLLSTLTGSGGSFITVGIQDQSVSGVQLVLPTTR